MVVSMVVSLVAIIFITAVFVGTSLLLGMASICINIAPQGTSATEALINSSADVQECSPTDK